MLFEGVKSLFSNWRLTLVELLPAIWVWAAMLDLRLHVFQGNLPRQWIEGPMIVGLVVAATVITALCYYLNAVFAFAVA
jgi:hypothetical protein